MTAAYNHDLCEYTHRKIESRLEQGESKMTALEKCGNNHEQRLAIMETVAARQESLWWRLVTPAMGMVSGVATALAVWILTH